MNMASHRLLALLLLGFVLGYHTVLSSSEQTIPSEYDDGDMKTELAQHDTSASAAAPLSELLGGDEATTTWRYPPPPTESPVPAPIPAPRTKSNKKKKQAKKRKKKSKNKKKRSKSNKSSKDDNNNKDNEVTSPTTSSPTSSPNGDSTFRLTNGGDHTLDPEDIPNNSNIILENGSHLTVHSGVSIESKGFTTSNTNNYYVDSTIHVHESSLKIQGEEIVIMGSNHEYNPNGDTGGHAITYLQGSKGQIGCDFNVGSPPITTPPPPNNSCQVGPNVLPACGINEFCQLDVGSCNTEISNIKAALIRRGVCTERPEACIEIYEPICGCNGVTYGNECTARAAGVNVSFKGECDARWPPNCRPGQCIDPTDGRCAATVRCVADPCEDPVACTGEECTANFCGGCHAVCGPRPPAVMYTTTKRDFLEEGDEEEEEEVEEEEGEYMDLPDASTCLDGNIRVIGGEGNMFSEGGSGRGGIGLRVYGQDLDTKVVIGGATIIGGRGSIQGYSLEIANAEVTIGSGYFEGEVLVAKRGSLHVYGGTFVGTIEVLDSAVVFYGCFENLSDRRGETSTVYNFQFAGDEELITVDVNNSFGEIDWVETDECN